MASQANDVIVPDVTYFSFNNKCIMCGFLFIHAYKDSSGNIITKKHLKNKLKLTERRLSKIVNALGMDVEFEEENGICSKCFRAIERLENLHQKAYQLKCALRQSAAGAKEISVQSPSSDKSTMETLMPARCEYFCISLDLVKGNTIVSGTELGKQFALEDLCKSVGVNIFAAFLNFCKGKIRREKKVVNKIPSDVKATTVIPIAKATTVTPISEAIAVTPIVQASAVTPITHATAVTPVTEPTTVTPIASPISVAPISQATTVTPNAAGVEFIFPVKLTPATIHHFETNSQLQNVESFEESLLSSTIANTGTLEKRPTSDDVTSNNCSLQLEGNTVSDDKQFTAVVKLEAESEVDTTEHNTQVLIDYGKTNTGNSLLHSELYQDVPKNNSNLMEQEEHVGTESCETILIKKEPEWEDQERGEGVHGEITQDSSHGSCTKDVEEGSFKAPESDTCTENENNLLEPSKNSTESNENLGDLSLSTSREDLSEPIQEMTKFEGDILRPSNNQPDKQGNNPVPFELDPNVPKCNSNLMEQEEDVSTENTETALIKEGSELKGQEREEEVRGEVTLNSFSYGSCTKDVEEGALKAPESDTCAENENDLWEPSENTEENDEEIWEPPKKKSKTKSGLLKPSNSVYQPDKQENTLLNLEKSQEEEIINRHEDERRLREGEVMIQIELPAEDYCKIWRCHCKKAFKSQQELLSHDEECHKVVLRLCEYCGQFMKNYKHHVQTHQPSLKRRNYLCTTCGMSYLNQTALTRHMENIHDGKKFKCQDCDKEFRGEQALKRHQLSNHMNMLNHVCCYCGKKFVTKNSMQIHMRVHTGEKPYACEYCGEKFNHNVSRKNHIRKAHPGREIKNPAKDFSR